MTKRSRKTKFMLMAGGEMPCQPVIRPLNTALLLIAIYIFVVVVYIWVSGILAARAAETVEELRRFETTKGFIYAVVSSVGLFLLVWYLLSRIARLDMKLFEQRDALVIAERRAVAGVFAASVAHDINNILMLLRYDVEELQHADELNLEHKTIMQQLGPAVEDLAVMSKRLAAAGQKSIPGEFVELDLVDLVRNTVEFARAHATLRHCMMEIAGEKSLIMRANPTIIRLMLLNLLLNAGDATGGEGHIQIRIEKTAGQAVLEVHDNGPGVSEEDRPHLFAPYHTTKGHRKGIGLGLVSVRVYVEAHAGSISINDSPLGGACFSIRMPITRGKQKS